MPAESIASISRRLYDHDAPKWAGADHLFAAELALLDEFRGRWHEVRMLDLGVGAGRTTRFFAPIVRSYVGMDIAPGMVALARDVVSRDRRVRVGLGDARDLSRFAASTFDLVLFSFNGIDHMGYDDRMRVLSGVHRVLRSGGVFLYSSHCLRGLRSRVRTLEGSARERWLADNPMLVGRARPRDFAVVREGRFPVVYVDPRAECRRLHEVGLRPTRVVDRAGEPVVITSGGRSRFGIEQWWLHYHAIATPRARASRDT